MNAIVIRFVCMYPQGDYSGQSVIKGGFFWFLRLPKLEGTIFTTMRDAFIVGSALAGKENLLVKQARSLDSDHVSFVLVSFYLKYTHSSSSNYSVYL